MKKFDFLFACIATAVIVVGCARQNPGRPAASGVAGSPNAPSRFAVPASQLASVSEETGATVANLALYYIQQSAANNASLMSDGGCSMAYDVVDALSSEDFSTSAPSYCADLTRRGMSANCSAVTNDATQITTLDYNLIGMCANDGDVSQMAGVAEQLVSALQAYRAHLGLY